MFAIRIDTTITTGDIGAIAQTAPGLERHVRRAQLYAIKLSPIGTGEGPTPRTWASPRPARCRPVLRAATRTAYRSLSTSPRSRAALRARAPGAQGPAALALCHRNAGGGQRKCSPLLIDSRPRMRDARASGASAVHLTLIRAAHHRQARGGRRERCQGAAMPAYA